MLTMYICNFYLLRRCNLTPEGIIEDVDILLTATLKVMRVQKYVFCEFQQFYNHLFPELSL